MLPLFLVPRLRATPILPRAATAHRRSSREARKEPLGISMWSPSLRRLLLGMGSSSLPGSLLAIPPPPLTSPSSPRTTAESESTAGPSRGPTVGGVPSSGTSPCPGRSSLPSSATQQAMTSLPVLCARTSLALWMGATGAGGSTPEPCGTSSTSATGPWGCRQGPIPMWSTPPHPCGCSSPGSRPPWAPTRWQPPFLMELASSWRAISSSSRSPPPSIPLAIIYEPRIGG